MTSGLETDWDCSGRMKRNRKAKKKKQVRKGKKGKVKDQVEGGKVKG